jgi:GT2 family glycosyltransferase
MLNRFNLEKSGMTSTPPAAPLVSIIILNYNGIDLTVPCLESLRQLNHPNYELLVVDNGSTDNSMKVLEAISWIRLVRIEQNCGSSGGYNFGLTQAKGEFILMMNNDMIGNPEFVCVLSRYLVEHPKVGIVQGKMVLPRVGGVLEVCGSYLSAIGLPYHIGYYKPDGPKYQRSYPVFCGKGACMMFRREVIAAAGGYYFNPDFHCYYEESDLCHRAWLAGYETHFVASPPIQHLSGVTIARSERAGFGIYYYLRNMMYSLLTILQPWWLLRIMPLYVAMLVASMVAAFVSGRRAIAKAHWDALFYNLKSLGKIRATRRRIQALRKQSDSAIFAQVLRTPRLEYFVKTFQGKLGEYVD